MTADGFPLDDYTPHGYLDIPEHTRRLTPRGVVRSHDLGFRWHFPAYAGGYGGRREVYRAGLRVGVDGAFREADFEHLVAPYHSKDLIRFEAGAISAEFHLAGPDVLVARVRGAAGRLTVRADYSRQIAADHGWGESGLVGRRYDDAVVLQGFEDGEAFAFWLSEPATVALSTDPEVADRWTRDGVPGPVDGPVTALGAQGEWLDVAAVAEPEHGHDLVVLLARGRTADEALARLAEAREGHPAARETLLAEDERFWSAAPRLSGDWPEHWRRGLVYDLETVRMMVKPPAGIYRHPWDAMQVQAPRVVLGEAAIDALLLCYADPSLAQRLLLGTFADAPAPNVPCSREDGSYNMVSADGRACGTGPQWGYPWRVLRRLWDANPDPDWLAAIYPHLGAYLDWWLAHRRDRDGWLAHACSWESGQDLSPRFGDQPLGGGHPTDHLRPVDLHAAVADAAATMAHFADVLGRDVAVWETIAATYAEATAKLFTGSRYADVDGRTGEPTGVDDVMLWAPLALGLAGPEQTDAVRDAIRAVDPDDLVWPMFVWTVVDAALAAGEHGTAAAVAGAVVDRAYTFWDARQASEDRTLPGIACEYWPVSGRCGGEGYGWGAFGIHLVLGVLAGLRFDGDRLLVRPNLPADLRVPARCYEIRLAHRGRPVSVALRPRQDGVDVDVDGRTVALAWSEEGSWRL
jgi:mannosylglycerate hydrolase MGH1-like protein